MVLKKGTGKQSLKKAGKLGAQKIGAVEGMERHVREVLMELMASSASDSVRVAAAKALMDKLGKDGDDVLTQAARKKRLAAVREAQKLLEEIAGGKSCRFDGKGEVDQDCASGATHSDG